LRHAVRKYYNSVIFSNRGDIFQIRPVNQLKILLHDIFIEKASLNDEIRTKLKMINTRHLQAANVMTILLAVVCYALLFLYNRKIVSVNFINIIRLVYLMLISGCKVTLAENGRECLDILEKKKFDLILPDSQMPVMDGLETIGAVRESETEALQGNRHNGKCI